MNSVGDVLRMGIQDPNWVGKIVVQGAVLITLSSLIAHRC